MRINRLLKTATFLKRKSDIIIEADDNGEKISLYCPNEKQIKNSCILGTKIWYSPAEFVPIYRPPIWQLAEIDGGRLVLTNSNLCLDLLLEGFSNNVIDINNDYSEIFINHKLVKEHYFDCVLKYNSKLTQSCYMKISNTSLLQEGKKNIKSYFPEKNYSSYYGSKDVLYDLIAAKLMGHRAILFCFILAENCNELYLTGKYDPPFAELLKTAIDLGVELMAYNIKVNNDNVEIVGSINIITEELGLNLV